ncbi:hypothetical protein COOONC_12387 [Cooperia oncophora]
MWKNFSKEIGKQSPSSTPCKLSPTKHRASITAFVRFSRIRVLSCIIADGTLTEPGRETRTNLLKLVESYSFNLFGSNDLIFQPRVRSQVKKRLKDLLVIQDLHTFEQRFAEVLAFLQVEGQDRMEDYLRRRTPTWASFSIPNAVMDTTMVSERWHLRLKTEFLHRNANTRADCLVDLLITAVEDLSRSDEIKARRRLVVASYRVQQTAICHRQAKKECDLNRLRIRQLSSETWELYSVKTTELLHVQRRNDCECSDSAEQNVLHHIYFILINNATLLRHAADSSLPPIASSRPQYAIARPKKSAILIVSESGSWAPKHGNCIP